MISGPSCAKFHKFWGLNSKMGNKAFEKRVIFCDSLFGNISNGNLASGRLKADMQDCKALDPRNSTAHSFNATSSKTKPGFQAHSEIF